MNAEWYLWSVSSVKGSAGLGNSSGVVVAKDCCCADLNAFFCGTYSLLGSFGGLLLVRLRFGGDNDLSGDALSSCVLRSLRDVRVGATVPSSTEDWRSPRLPGILK